SRLRIGIGRPVNGKKPVDFVLSSPQNDEDAIRFQGAIETGISALEVMILENVKAAMDRYNRKKETNETVFE
ncbi:MAG TPA: aminoacyl-tRNA hydrolase, partial [bacterium]|nr:aminoacyl-tRNA hydrolase [bacterium]